jgi:hypothetical protein
MSHADPPGETGQIKGDGQTAPSTAEEPNKTQNILKARKRTKTGCLSTSDRPSGLDILTEPA